MKNNTNFIIIGAGLFGVVVAQQLASSGKKVILVDKRDHIGGNCYDYHDSETGIIVHKYGPHIFHVNDKNILRYIQQYTDFNNYKHQVFANYKGKLYNFPVNLSTINSYFGINLKPFEVREFILQEIQKTKIVNPTNLEEKIMSLVGESLYNAFFKEYTIKQWGKTPSELPESIISRIPIKTNYDTSYYKKYFNGIPKDGFTVMFKKMIIHKNIELLLSTDFFENKDYFFSKGKIVFTGPIDAYFDYKYGKLEYRSLKFERELHDKNDLQGNSVVNYPELKYDFTRICEPKHFYPELWQQYSLDKTLIFKEIPLFDVNQEPYYPINDLKNINCLRKYIKETRKMDNVFFGGRLGEYKYYDMEDTIKSALKLSKKLITKT